MSETEALAAELAVRKHAGVAPAIVAALAEVAIIDKGKTANAGSYSYSYADIADVIAETRPILAAHGLVAVTALSGGPDVYAVTVEILHSTGESKVYPPVSFNGGRDPQAVGSSITYFRRYALCAALGIATGEDDDGAAAKAAARRPEQPPRLLLSPKAQENLRERCAAIEASVSEVVKAATGGRTIDPAGVFEDEIDAVKAVIAGLTPAAPSGEGDPPE